MCARLSGTVRMSSEIEAKFRLSGHDDFRGALIRADAERIGAVIETNSFHDLVGLPATAGALQGSGAALRVRSLEMIDGRPQSATLTFKGPIEPSAFKKREELELPLSDADGMRRLLSAVGFKETLRFQKRRESWRLRRCRVELDQLPGLGCFVEIEGPDEHTIQTVREVLGLGQSEPVSRSYAGLIADAFVEDIAVDRTIAFDPVL